VEKAVRTYKEKDGAYRRQPSLRPSPILGKIEVGPLPMKILDRRRSEKSILPLSGLSGIPISKHTRYNVTMINNLWLALITMHQLSCNAYNYGDLQPDIVRAAMREYHFLRRKLLQWGSVLCDSIVVRQYWTIISLTMRLAQSLAKQKGRPLCGINRDETLSHRPLSLGIMD
jgi:hypothetical protein